MDDDVANDDAAVESTDSIQEEFGYEYSEDTLNLLRSIPKPLWKEEQDAETSLDPVGELSEYLAHDLPLPPPVYDTMQHVGAEALAELQEAMDRKPDPQEQQDAEYRTQLARGTDPREMTWLKLRAYHRAMNQPVNAMVTKKRGVMARCAGAQKAREVMAQRRATQESLENS
ncbi:uncharacterized protein HaLaN_21065 [Haematococcus lacustris]|uniref:Uncharacterized protein n=1 Tax=Haematococcus lacustris TaxID=44745 RepID=A0A699ZMR2_HAELA|nr:uncharacterized protein HaLaN_21065 [Haematococcus lacustris]